MSDFYNLTVTKVKPETKEAITLTLGLEPEVEKKFVPKAGQYVKLRTIINNNVVERFYSICNFGKNFIQVGIKRMEGGVFSEYANNIPVGTVLSVSPPLGNFHIPDPKEMTANKNLYFVAAGGGITPILSMVREVLSNYEDTKVTLFFVNSTQKEIMFFKELEDLKNKYVARMSLAHIITREPGDIPLLSTRPTSENIPQLLQAFGGSQNPDFVYLCGPLPFMEAFREAFLTRGLDKNKIKMEYFGTSSAEKKKSTVKYSETDNLVTVIFQGRSQTVSVPDGQNVLAAALDAGADVPFACQGGVCATCKAKLVEGKAEMSLNYGLEDDQVEKGYFLTCQTTVQSPNAIFDFDM